MLEQREKKRTKTRRNCENIRFLDYIVRNSEEHRVSKTESKTECFPISDKVVGVVTVLSPKKGLTLITGQPLPV
jgi:hypothetical protein